MEPVDSTERDTLPPRQDPAAGAEDEPTRAEKPEKTKTAFEQVLGVVFWILRLALALFLFIGALQLMKEGAASLDILKPGGYLVQNPGSTLGLGWLGALFVLSGSPIAATALTLVAGGEEAAAAGAAHFTEMQGFTMLTGSRLGAAFVVLVTAVVYALRGGSGERLKPVSTAVMALCTTALIYIPAAFMGFALLRWEPFHNLELTFPGQFADIIDIIYGPTLDRLEGWNGAVLFLGGLAILLISFKVIDSVMPKLDDKAVERRGLSWMTRKWPMFALGSLVALITMSVSVALTVLVPLVSKGYVKREHIIPYIMGANITTLGDTMLAAFALNSPAAVRIVLAEVIVTSVLSLILLTFFYPQLRSGIWRFQRQVTKSKPRLAVFTVGLFVVPIATIAIAGLAG